MLTPSLHGKTIAVLATDGFEQVELTKPVEALKAAGAAVEIVAPKSGQIQGFNHHDKGDKTAVDKALAEADPADYDGLVLPGGVINPDALRLEEAARSRCVFDPGLGQLTVGVVPGLSEWQLQERVRIWFQAEARRVFAERLDWYAARLGVQYRALALSSAGTRWGSCTVEGNIRLNWRLIHYALPLIDYVVAHELAHLKEMNHSPRFWATVETVYPDYEGAKAALRKRSQEMPVLFT